MKKSYLFLILVFIGLTTNAQKIKLKNTINYNAFGMDAIPYEQLMFGGNHVFYKSFGMAVSYRFGIKDFLEPINGTMGNQEDYNIIKQNKLFTDKSSTAYSFAFVPSLAIAITHKLPIYFGVGITRKRIYREFAELGSGNKFWIEDKAEQKYLPTFTVGTFIPIYRRLLLNIAYDHLPQSVFIGISIRSWDAWDEFN